MLALLVPLCGGTSWVGPSQFILLLPSHPLLLCVQLLLSSPPLLPFLLPFPIYTLPILFSSPSFPSLPYPLPSLPYLLPSLLPFSSPPPSLSPPLPPPHPTVSCPAAATNEVFLETQTQRDLSDLVYVCSPEACTALQHSSIHLDYLADPGTLLPEDVSNFALQIAEGMSHLERLNVSAAIRY